MNTLAGYLFFLLGFSPLSAACSSGDGGLDTGAETHAEVQPDIDTSVSSEVESEIVDPELPDVVGDSEVEVDARDGDDLEVRDTDVPTAEDGAPCRGLDYAQLGCPCDPSSGYQQCCIKIAYGMECSAFFKVWTDFSDCGCDPNPACGPEPPFGLCNAPAYPEE